MSGSVAHEPGAGKRATPSGRLATRRPAHGLDPFAVIRNRAHTRLQAESCERALRYFCRVERSGRVDRTWKQLAAGLGYDVSGMNQRQARVRYRSRIERTIGYLTAWGLLDGRTTLWEGEAGHSEGRCIVVSVPAGVAQSVEASPPRRMAHTAPGGPPRRPHATSLAPSSDPDPSKNFCPRNVGTPPRERRTATNVRRNLVVSPIQQRGNGGASARVPGDAREAAGAHAARRRRLVKASAAASLVSAPGIEREGLGAALASLPALVELETEPAARLLHRLILPEVPPRLSAKRQAQLEAAARRIDHYSSRRGAWIVHAVMILQTWRAGEMCWHVSEPPRSLGALAVELRRLANDIRHNAIASRSERIRPLAAARRRQSIKRWRTDVRRLEREAGPHAGRTVPKPPRPGAQR